MRYRLRTRWTWLVGMAYAATVLLFVLANKLTTSASTIFLQSTAPIYLVLLGPLVLKEPVRRRDVLFMVALGLGLALFFVGHESGSATAPDPIKGRSKRGRRGEGERGTKRSLSRSPAISTRQFHRKAITMAKRLIESRSTWSRAVI